MDANAPTIAIEPKSRFDQNGIKELWQYRDLLHMFVRKDLVVVYKQTILGPLWYVLQPLIMTVMMLLVFTDLAGLSTDGIPPILFYMSGLCLWTYYSNVTSTTSEVFIKNAQLFGKVYFPRLIVPLSHAISNLVKLLMLIILLGLIYVAYVVWGNATQLRPNAWLFALPILIAFVGMFAMSCGLLVAALTVKYRDLQLLIGFGLQMLMYACPIAYSLNAVPERWRIWLLCNPLTSLIEAVRAAFFGIGEVSTIWLIYSFAVITGLFVRSIIVFSNAERTFIDKI